MSRRLTTLVLAAFYLLQATWLLHAGVDLLLPAVRQAAAAVADSCCTNACGCPEDVKAAHGCCCVKGAAAARPKTAPRSAIEEARCKGVEDAMAQALTQPVVCAFAALERPDVRTSGAILLHPTPVLPWSRAAVDKVPIA